MGARERRGSHLGSNELRSDRRAAAHPRNADRLRRARNQAALDQVGQGGDLPAAYRRAARPARLSRRRVSGKIRRRRRGHAVASAGRRGALALRRVDRADLRGAHVALDRAYRGVRIRRAARSLRSRHACGEEARRVVPDRAELRFRCGRDAHEGDAGRRQLFDHRLQDVYHQRHGRRCVRRDGDDRSGARARRRVSIHRRSRHGGTLERKENREAGAARVRHRRSYFRKRHGPGAQPGRRARRGISGRRSRCSKRGESESLGSRRESRAADSRKRAHTRSNARSSARRLPSSRRFNGCSPTWRLESTRHGYSSAAPPR